MTRSAGCRSVELSALREGELLPLLDALDSLDLSAFSYVSIHAPSRFNAEWEQVAVTRLRSELHRESPVVAHPDALHDLPLWREFGTLLCIENMDKRKPFGRTARELDLIFFQLPDASLCFDIGHARQYDPTMTEACLILREFGRTLRQVHISEVNTASKHDPLSWAPIRAFQAVAHPIPENVPLILETPVELADMSAEIEKAHQALTSPRKAMVA